MADEAVNSFAVGSRGKQIDFPLLIRTERNHLQLSIATDRVIRDHLFLVSIVA